MTETPFADEYHTAADHGTPGLIPILGRTRIPFYWYILRALVKARGIVRRGDFTDEIFVREARAVMSIIEDCGGRFHITGLDRIRALDGPAVLIGNHMSTMETFILPAMVLPHQPLSFVVKRSLVELPIFGPVLASQRPICVGRENPRADLRTVLTEGQGLLAEGRCLCVFPQSTRRVIFDPRKFNSIGVKLAARAGVPVLPFALRTDFWGNSSGPLKDLGPIGRHRDIHFAFGDAIPPERSPKETQALVLDYVRSHLEAWGVPCLS